MAKRGRVIEDSDADNWPMERRLLDRFAQLAHRHKPGARVAPAASEARHKEAVLAAAQAREEAARLRFERDQERKRQRLRGQLPAPAPLVAPAGAGGMSASGGVEEAPARSVRPSFDVEEARRLFPDCEFQPLRSHPDIVRLNPHLKQNEEGVFRVPLDRMPTRLQPDMPRKAYEWLQKTNRSTLHVGVRKLLLLEVEFLCNFEEVCTFSARASAGADAFQPPTAWFACCLRGCIARSARASVGQVVPRSPLFAHRHGPSPRAHDGARRSVGTA